MAQVRFRDVTRGYNALAYLRCTSGGGFSTILPPGTYEVRVESSTYSGNAGINLLPVSFVANGALVISAPVSNLLLNEIGHAVSGTVQVNGAAPTFSIPTYCMQAGRRPKHEGPSGSQQRPRRPPRWLRPEGGRA